MNQDITFGPGLTEAYLMEENNAKYPRIILTKEILKDIDEKSKKNNIEHASLLKFLAFRDEDAFYALNSVRMLIDDDQTTRKKVEDIIMQKLDTMIDSSIREKYLYLEKRMKQEIKLSGIRNTLQK